MKAPDCPAHGELVMDFARGRLDDQRAEEAETVHRDCAACARWWDETFHGESYHAVDGVTEEVISSFVPPARPSYRWLAAVAALVLAIGVGATSFLWRDVRTSPAPASDVLSTWDFEPGTFDEAVAAADDATGASEASNDEETVFVGDFESGDLSGWSTDS